MDVGRHESPTFPFLPYFDRYQFANECSVQRVVDKDTARFENSCDLRNYFRQVLHVLQDIAAKDKIKQVVSIGQTFTSSFLIPDIKFACLGVISRGLP